MPSDFATHSDLEMQTGGTINPDAGYRALHAATNAIIADLGWDPRQSVRTYTIPAYARVGYLPAKRVTAVSAVENAVPVMDVKWDEYGAVHLPWHADVVTVTYTAGWSEADLPDVFIDVCAEEASRRLSGGTNGALRSYGLGDETESYFEPASVTSDTRLDAYRLPAGVA